MSAETEQESQDSSPVTAQERAIVERRFDEFLRYGIDELDAWMLADSKVDVGRVRKLVRLDCPPNLIRRIEL